MLYRDIIDDINRMQRKLDRMLSDVVGDDLGSGGAVGSRRPVTTAEESDKEFVFNIELPGVEKEDVSVAVADGTVEVRAERKSEKEMKDKGSGSYSYSSSSCSFYRSFSLPENADADNIDASFNNGLLTLRVPKTRASKQVRSVKVK